MKKEKSCGALVYLEKGSQTKLLVLKHKYGGHWSFPKGHVESEENEFQTALREVKEETGLSIQLVKGFRETVEYHPKPNVSKQVVYFLGKASTDQVIRQEDEISEIRWLPLEEAPNWLSFDNHRQLILKAKPFILQEQGKGRLSPSKDLRQGKKEYRSMKEEKSCGAVLLRRECDELEVLLVRHRNGSHWSFPKGHMEAGERERQTALREIREETGLEVRLLPEFRMQVAYSPKSGVWKQVVYFAGLPAGGILHPQEEEIRDLLWISSKEALKMVTYENDRQVLSEALAFVQRQPFSFS